jgi:hypothetical protein
MRIPLSLKLVIATWIAALLGALAGRSLAEVSSDTGAHAHVVAATLVVAR